MLAMFLFLHQAGPNSLLVWQTNKDNWHQATILGDKGGGIISVLIAILIYIKNNKQIWATMSACLQRLPLRMMRWLVSSLFLERVLRLSSSLNGAEGKLIHNNPFPAPLCFAHDIFSRVHCIMGPWCFENQKPQPDGGFCFKPDKVSKVKSISA